MPATWNAMKPPRELYGHGVAHLEPESFRRVFVDEQAVRTHVGDAPLAARAGRRRGELRGVDAGDRLLVEVDARVAEPERCDGVERGQLAEAFGDLR